MHLYDCFICKILLLLLNAFFLVNNNAIVVFVAIAFNKHHKSQQQQQQQKNSSTPLKIVNLLEIKNKRGVICDLSSSHNSPTDHFFDRCRRSATVVECW